MMAVGGKCNAGKLDRHSADFNGTLQHKGLDLVISLVHTSVMPEPSSLANRAEADLAFVRGVMARSHQFTAVPGLGGVLMGATAIVAAVLASLQPSRERWLTVWIAESVIAFTIGLITLFRKARSSGTSLSASPARRFALGIMPPVLVGALLTYAATQANAWELLAPIWLCCYGIGVLGAGAASAVPSVLVLGTTFVVVGGLSVITPAEWVNVWLGLAFGVAHVCVGAVVMRRHGG